MIAFPMAVPQIYDLTLDEKIGQLFVIAARGNFMNESSPAFRELLRRVEETRVGGIIFFESHVHATAWLCARLQECARVPLLVSADLEAGTGMRFPEVTWWPPAMAIAATGDPANAEILGRVTAREAKAIGIQQVLAPVADVNVNPRNPVINTRSFGEDPEQVSRYVAAFIEGVQSEGLIATAKHFPGHGDTAIDSHRALPVLDVTRERLDAVELVPFRAAIASGVRSVMIGHLSVRVLDPERVPVRLAHGDNPYGTASGEVPDEGTMPATLSEPMVNGLLRRELGFNGLVVTDAFDMGGVVEHFDAAEAAVRAIAAGCDQVLMPADLDAAVDGVRSAVRSGRLAMSKVDDAVRRILQVKSSLAFGSSQGAMFRDVDSAAHRDAARRIAEHAITVVAGAGVLPKPLASAGVLIISDLAEPLPALGEFEQEVASRTSCVTARLDGRSSSEEALAAIHSVLEFDAVVIALAIRARSGLGRISIPPAVREALAAIPAGKTAAVSFGSPHVIHELPPVATYVCAYGPQPVMQRAAARVLFGEIVARGRLPVTL